MQCPYCKLCLDNLPDYRKAKGVVCINCRWHYDATSRIWAEMEEEELFRTYWAIPINWRDWDQWRSDPYYLKANNPYMPKN